MAGGILLDLGEDLWGDAADRGRLAHQPADGQCRQAAIRHDQRPVDAEAAAGLAQLHETPGAEADLRRKQPVAAPDLRQSLFLAHHPYSSPVPRGTMTQAR